MWFAITYTNCECPNYAQLKAPVFFTLPESCQQGRSFMTLVWNLSILFSGLLWHDHTKVHPG